MNFCAHAAGSRLSGDAVGGFAAICYTWAMSKTVSLTLAGGLGDFVQAEVNSGRYRSEDEVLRAGLRLLEREEERRRALNAALLEGELSGTAEEFEFEAFIRRKRAGD